MENSKYISASPRYIIGIDEVGRAAQASLAQPKYIIGIDEVGRGCLAGPVVVVAVALPAAREVGSLKLEASRKSIPLRDSKKLLPHQREAWSKYLRSHPEVKFAVARTLPRTIEKKNIARAANQAALVALKKLLATSDWRPGDIKVVLDGGLFLGQRRRVVLKYNQCVECEVVVKPFGRVRTMTIVRGDEKIPAISAASIIAKVHRDRYMTRLAKKFPEYGFEIHKGYATKRHQNALLKHGPLGIHRRTFLRKLVDSSSN